jgi:hypothetical protein
MNFIIDLSSSKHRSVIYDEILVVVDRFIKYARYISARKDWIAEHLTDVIFDEVFNKFDMLEFIVSDRESLFTSHYWSDFCFYLRVKIRLSIVYHSQTDKQTKRQNQILEQYLRCYVNYQQNDWTKWLSIVEYVYNNSWHSIIKISSFVIIFDESFQWEQYQESRDDDVSAISVRIVYSEKLRDLLYKRLKDVRDDQAKYYDQKHISKSYNVKDKELLNSKNIKTNRFSKKLDHKYLRSFEIELLVEKQTYRLRLSKSYQSIHNVFHVSLLKSYRRRVEIESSSSLTLLENDEHFEIESILNSRVRYEKLE